MITVEGLGFIQGGCSPHYQDGQRVEQSLLASEHAKIFCIDNCAAIEFNNEKMKIISSAEEAQCRVLEGRKSKTLDKNKVYNISSDL